MGFWITKTLIKEFLQCPKFAWWHVNCKDVYAYIQANLYGSMDMASIWKDVEDFFLQRYHQYTHIIDPFDTKQTQEAIFRWDVVIYQPVFQIDGLYTRPDILIKNPQGIYDCIEIKSKTSVRNKSIQASLYDDLLYDISFQSYVLTKALWDRYSGVISLAYLRKDFVKQWPIHAEEFFVQEDCSAELLDPLVIQGMVANLQQVLLLDELSFDAKYPYNGENPLLYFGHMMEKDSIFSIKWRYSIKPFIIDRYAAGKESVHELSVADITPLAVHNGTGERIAGYIKNMQGWQVVLDRDRIVAALSVLQYPLCFYDYETVATPMPLFDGYRPWQQIVVQYSMHIVYEDGRIDHKQSIIGSCAVDNKYVVDDFLRAIGDGYGTYIVWNKSFENGRNDDIALLYPEYAALFHRINQQTFDLMDVFKQDMYFHPDFVGSASIKKVLPVLTDISYDSLAVGDGSQATALLQQLINWTLQGHVDAIIKDLCDYCTQDSWAMVQIWKILIESIKIEV
jgi:hypothetical protein